MIFQFQKHLNHLPDYMDDRLTFDVTLSNNLQYRTYSLIESNKVSAYYDTNKNKAFTVTDISDVPDDFKDKLTRYTTSAKNDILMFPAPPTIETVDTGKTITLNEKPQFDDDNFSISWGDGTISSYNNDSPLSSLQHTYADYGTYKLKFSNNITKLVIGGNNNNISKIQCRNRTLSNLYTFNQSKQCKEVKAYGVKTIDSYWYDCYELSSIEFPDLQSIEKAYALNCLFNLKYFKAPKLERINQAQSTFKANINLEEVYFPNLTTISTDNSGFTFQTCVSLSAAYMPKLVNCPPGEFAFCVNLVSTDFSSLSIVSEYMFDKCISLKEIKLPSVKHIQQYAFLGCKNLITIDLTKCNEVPILDNANAFDYLPSNYKILVNSSKINDFKNAQSWSEIKNHIFTT